MRLPARCDLGKITWGVGGGLAAGRTGVPSPASRERETQSCRTRLAAPPQPRYHFKPEAKIT